MKLTIKKSNSEDKTIDLTATGRTSWLIGRDPVCDIPLPPDLGYISKRHATLKVEGGKWKLAVHSANGVMIDEYAFFGNDYVFDFDRKQSYIIKLGNIEDNDANAICTLILHLDVDIMIRGKGEKNGSVAKDNLKLIMEFEKDIHNQILDDLHLSDKSIEVLDKKSTKEDVKQQLCKILKSRFDEICPYVVLDQDLENNPDVYEAEEDKAKKRDLKFIKIEEEILNNILHLGPITPLLDDKTIDEVMVNGYDMIFIERNGIIEQVKNVQFYDNQQLLSIIQRIVEQVGRHINTASPMVDARLEDGSRVNAIIPPLAIDGPSLTIRKFKDYAMTTDDLIKFGTMNEEMAQFLELAVKSRQNIVISGGTGSGKTTLLNVLGQFIPPNERLVIIEDSAELRLTHVNKVRLEARPANIQGTGEVTIRKLLVNSLRMRPDRIIIGECRSGEALDMLQAMNTGHDGSLTTVHANSPRDALSRLENMVLMAGFELPISAIRDQTASAINLVIQQNRLSDGSRKIVEIAEITGREGNTISMQPIFLFEEKGMDANGRIIGEFKRTGLVPKFWERLRKKRSNGSRTYASAENVQPANI